MKYRLILMILFALVISFSCKANSFDKIKLSKENLAQLSLEKEIMTMSDVIISIAYKTDNIKVELGDQFYFIIDYAYFIIDDQIAGYIDKNGIYNKSGEKIFDSRYQNIIGICSQILEYPGSPSYVFEKEGRFMVGDTATVLGFDSVEKTVRLVDYEL